MQKLVTSYLLRTGIDCASFYFIVQCAMWKTSLRGSCIVAKTGLAPISTDRNDFWVQVQVHIKPLRLPNCPAHSALPHISLLSRRNTKRTSLNLFYAKNWFGLPDELRRVYKGCLKLWLSPNLPMVHHGSLLPFPRNSWSPPWTRHSFGVSDRLLPYW